MLKLYAKCPLLRQDPKLLAKGVTTAQTEGRETQSGRIHARREYDTAETVPGDPQKVPTERL